MFVKNTWYVAAWDDEIEPGKLLARRLLGEDVVLFRTEDGTVTALEDRCPHRALPLSHGIVQGNTIECGYHGLQFDANGTCVRIPCQDRIPAGAHVRHYPVVEQDHAIWIWMGDHDKADASRIVRHVYHDHPDWFWVKGRYQIGANYQLINDNLLDLTHVGYVHGSTIGGTPQDHSAAATKVTRTDTGVMVSRWMPNSVPPPSYVAAFRFKTERVDRWMDIEFIAPAVVRIHTGAKDVNTGAAEGNREGGTAFMGLNAQTPETETSTHYFWSGARNRTHGKPDATEQLRKSLETTFAEDKDIVEWQQAAIDRKPDAPLVMISSDAGMLQARRYVDSLLEAEAQAGNPPAAGKTVPIVPAARAVSA